jgi:hypothetical protein
MRGAENKQKMKKGPLQKALCQKRVKKKGGNKYGRLMDQRQRREGVWCAAMDMRTPDRVGGINTPKP